jgi:hypothetical protein
MAGWYQRLFGVDACTEMVVDHKAAITKANNSS